MPEAQVSAILLVGIVVGLNGAVFVSVASWEGESVAPPVSVRVMPLDQDGERGHEGFLLVWDRVDTDRAPWVVRGDARWVMPWVPEVGEKLVLPCGPGEPVVVGVGDAASQVERVPPCSGASGAGGEDVERAGEHDGDGEGACEPAALMGVVVPCVWGS